MVRALLFLAVTFAWVSTACAEDFSAAGFSANYPLSALRLAPYVNAAALFSRGTGLSLEGGLAFPLDRILLNAGYKIEKFAGSDSLSGLTAGISYNFK